MIKLLMMIAMPIWGQVSISTNSTGLNRIQLDGHETAIAELQSGRPTITGIPNFQNGVQFNGVAVTTGSFSSGGSSTSTYSGTDISGVTIEQYITGSSITWTTAASTAKRWAFSFSGGGVYNDTAGGTICMGVRVDGALIDNEIINNQGLWNKTGGATTERTTSLYYLSNQTFSSGTHTVSFILNNCSDTGNAGISCSGANLCQYSIEEKGF